MSGGPYEVCSGCSGSGTVAHKKRTMANGEPDPADFRIHELCERCGGGGIVPVTNAEIAARANAQG